jgi:hypothetical protein
VIKIIIETIVHPDGKSDRQQVTEALAAIGFRPIIDVQYRLATDEETLGKIATDQHVAEKAAQAAEPAKRPGRPKKDAVKAEPPADPAPADVAQDAADEAAEVVEAKAAEPAKAEPVYDVNDMRSFGKAYADAYGMDATLSDIPGIIGFAAFSQVPADKVDAVARLVKTAVETNPNNRAKVA